MVNYFDEHVGVLHLKGVGHLKTGTKQEIYDGWTFGIALIKNCGRKVSRLYTSMVNISFKFSKKY